jgi:ubiquinone/menaquinone biosynthesis C-methylase UbiE
MSMTLAASSSNFHRFEHDGWQRVANRYDDLFGELTSQCIGPLLQAVNLGSGSAYLDVASGPGHLAAAAASRGARATGVDFSSTMIGEARARYPHVRFEEGDAQALPFPAAAFDAVTIAFGLLHFPDPDRALAEAFRVLRAGGRLGFAVWAEKAVGFVLVTQAVQQHGALDVGLPGGPPFFRFSDAPECRRTLTALGFEDVHSWEVPQVWRFRSPDEWIDGVARSTVRTAALLAAQSPQAMAKIRAALTEVAAGYRCNDGSISLPMPAVVTSARKP